MESEQPMTPEYAEDVTRVDERCEVREVKHEHK